MKVEITEGVQDSFDLKTLTPEEASQYSQEFWGQPVNLRGGITLMSRHEERRPAIIIDQTLPPGLQKVFLTHEKRQLEVITGSEKEGYPFSSIGRTAHEAGVKAGIEVAQAEGVLDEYLQIIGETNSHLAKRMLTSNT